MNLFQLGKFMLHSGDQSAFKIECDALTDTDLEALAFLIAERVGAFGAVEGVPEGGLRLAAALRLFVTEGPLLIVDDVYFSGASMEEHRAGRKADGYVIFARKKLDARGWVRALFTLD